MLGVAVEQEVLPVVLPVAGLVHVADAEDVDVARERARSVLHVLLGSAVHDHLFLGFEVIDLAVCVDLDAVAAELLDRDVEGHASAKARIEEQQAQRLVRQDLRRVSILELGREIQEVPEFLGGEIVRREKVALAQGISLVCGER